MSRRCRAGSIEDPLLQKGGRFRVVSKLEVQAGEERVVPERVPRIEPVGRLGGRHPALRLTSHPLHPGPEDLDHRVVRVHRPREVEVPFGPLEVAHKRAHHAERGMNPRVVGIERQRPLGEAQGREPMLVRLRRTPAITSMERLRWM